MDSKIHPAAEMMYRDALRERDLARARFEAARPSSPKWRRAGHELNFWQGKVTTMDILRKGDSK